MRDYDTTVLFKAISQKKATERDRYCRGGHRHHLAKGS